MDWGGSWVIESERQGVRIRVRVRVRVSVRVRGLDEVPHVRLLRD
jgi:hypothetical protein